MASSPRIRRDPEASKALILDAACAVFGEVGPDRAGLKEVAQRAGVSHALITRYFGTYDALVEAVVQHRLAQTVAGIAPLLATLGPTPPDEDFFARLAATAVDPIGLRLAAWLLLSGRYRGARGGGSTFGVLARLVDALEMAAQARGATDMREDLEFGVLASLLLLLGYETAKTALVDALGKEPSPSYDEAFRMRMLRMLNLYLSRPRE